jgi:mono/diheme cytochrome c family protein
MSNEDKGVRLPHASTHREKGDPEENVRPLPWFLIMFLGAMGMWGCFYIYTSQAGDDSSYGDQRTLSTLRPPVTVAGAATKIDGQQVFSARCSACHQLTGLGIPGVFPPLAGSEWVQGSPKIVASIVLHGILGEITVKGNTYKGAMPVFGALLSDDEIAAVTTYVRSSWGNKAPPITPEMVKAQREATKAQAAPYKGGDDLKTLDPGK